MKDDDQERNEDATPKRQEELRKKGTVLRSKELNTLLSLMAASIGFMVLGTNLVEPIITLTRELFQLSREELLNPNVFAKCLSLALDKGFQCLIPFLILMVVSLLFSPVALGGWSFSFDNIQLKLERLDPVSGLFKIFSLKSVVELIKSVAKVSVIIAIGFLLMFAFFDDFMTLSSLAVEQSIVKSVSMLIQLFFLMSCGLILIAGIDIPFQIWNFQKENKMSKQEVKDEYKEGEGNPEVKRKMHRIQREMARRRMMHAIKEADVVITNPEHYAVALKYKPSMRAPVVVAKGQDLIAEKIREKAKEHQVPLVAIPPLARAIYFSTDLEQPIPEGLYRAVAKVLAYIYQLRQYQKGRAKKPKMATEFDIPPDLKR